MSTADHASFRLPSPTASRTRTNPVWAFQTCYGFSPLRRINPAAADKELRAWIEQASSHQVVFPSFLRRTYPEFFCASSQSEEQPGVVGLLVKRSHNSSMPDLGLVAPLKVHTSSQLRVSHYLPFRESDIRDTIHRLILASGVPCHDVVPELLCYHLHHDLDENSSGSSMDIAGLLAVVDFLSNRSSKLLRRACAVVCPDGDALVEVESIEAKLTAFLREFQYGSLLICGEHTRVSEEMRLAFAEVWQVDSFQSLSKKLAESNLLYPLMRKQPLTFAQIEAAENYLQYLGESQGSRHALAFAQRLESAALAVENGDYLSLRGRQRLLIYLENGYRHVGDADNAARYSKASVQSHRDNQRFESFQTIAEAHNRLSAAMYDAHSFEEGASLLEPFVQRLQQQPELATGEVRAYINNTLARFLIVLQRDGWESLLRESIELQRQVEPNNVSRTQCYLLHGLIRNRSLAVAKDEFCLLQQDPSSSNNPYLPFYAQEYVRQGGQRNDFVDRLLKFSFHSDAHQKGLFLVARARGLVHQDVHAAAADFVNAASCFEKDAGSGNAGSILHLFAGYVRLASARLQNEEPATQAALARIEGYFTVFGSPSLKAWYSRCILDAVDIAGVERLLQRVPYF